MWWMSFEFAGSPIRIGFLFVFLCLLVGLFGSYLEDIYFKASSNIVFVEPSRCPSKQWIPVSIWLHSYPCSTYRGVRSQLLKFNSSPGQSTLEESDDVYICTLYSGPNDNSNFYY